MNANRAEIITFLEIFKTKANIYGLLYLDRPKNIDTLLVLNLAAATRDSIIFNLEVENYVQGPILNNISPYNLGDLWVFGTFIKRQAIYIKIQLGVPAAGTICISFHIAERPLHFPFTV